MNFKTLIIAALFFSVNFSQAFWTTYQTDTANYAKIYEKCAKEIDNEMQFPLSPTDISQPGLQESLSQFAHLSASDAYVFLEAAHLSETDAYAFLEELISKCLNGTMINGPFNCNSEATYLVYLTFKAIQKNAREELKRAETLLQK